MRSFVLKGNICCSLDKEHLQIAENSYVVCEEGKSKGVYQELPETYQKLPMKDYGEALILPGMVDLHVHAPQYPFRGIGMDLELLDWLNTNTFPEEKNYENLEYADKAYDILVEDLKKSATTRACLFGTLHTEATELLMKKLDQAGIECYVGKVSMDRNSPDYLCEESPEKAVEDTEKWILRSQSFKHAKPILTPRFIPTCSDQLMEGLSVLQKKYHLPMQSHLSENKSEIEWVRELCPGTRFYGEAYDRFGMFGGDCPTIMAHCIHSSEEEIALMKERKVFIAHCPESNSNLSSGIAPVRYYLEKSLKVGLGSDVAAGTSLSMFKAMAQVIQCSKLRWRLVDQTQAPLKVEEAFYLATKGGGEFFGKVGSFEEGYEFDAVVMDDSSIRSPKKLTTAERLERLIYLSEEAEMKAKYVAGKQITEA